MTDRSDPRADILQTCAGLPEERLAPGEVLLAEGAEGRAIFVLIEGAVDVTKGGVRIVRISAPGALFGEMSVLLGLPVSATVTALTETRVHRIDDPSRFIDETPAMARHTARLLAARLHAATTYIADLKVQFAEEAGHLAMMDRMLDAMMEGQLENLRLQPMPREEGSAPDGDDPRL